MISIAEDHAQLWERADPLAVRLLSAVRPLFLGRRNEPPEAIGTCVLLRVGPARLLLTAAHVVDEFLGEDILILGNGLLEGIRAQGVRIDPPKGKTREEDRIDVGILRVNSDHQLTIDGDFLTPASIGIDEPIRGSPTYLALGYPVKKTVVDSVARRVAPWPVKYVGVRSSPLTYNRLRLHPSTHVVIDFDQRRTVTDEGIRAVMKPKGMSGGGVWWWRNASLDNKYELPDARLTAILIEHRRTERVFIATRVFYHIAVIRKHWPDLVEHLAGFPSP